MRRTRFVDWSSNNLEREEKKRREQRRTLKHAAHVASLRFADHFATSFPYARKCSVVSMALKKRGENDEEKNKKTHRLHFGQHNDELVNGETLSHKVNQEPHQPPALQLSLILS